MTRRVGIALVVVFTVVAVGATAGGILKLATAGGPAGPANSSTPYVVLGEPIPVGKGAADIEAGFGFVWVSDANDGTITRIDPLTRATRSFPVGGEPGQIVVGEGAVWIRNLEDRITRLDPTTGAASAPIPGGAGPITGMAVGGGFVWLSHSNEDTVTRVDARTGAVVGVPLRVGSAPGVMEFDRDAVFVVGENGTLSRIDAAAATRVGSVSIGDSPGGMESDGGTIYVAASGGVVPADSRTLNPGGRYPFEGWSYFEVADGTMWVIYEEDPRIQRVDAASRSPIGDPIAAPGAEVGRARFAFDRLWMTLPDRQQVITVGSA